MLNLSYPLSVVTTTDNRRLASVQSLEHRGAHRAGAEVRADAGAELHRLYPVAREDRVDLFEQLLDVLWCGRIHRDHLLHAREVLDKGIQPLDRFGAGAGALVGDDLALVEEQ